jgi:polysaccharide pyruvyl transferase WcaK-like protein
MVPADPFQQFNHPEFGPMPDLRLQPARQSEAFEAAGQPVTQIELHIGRPLTAGVDIGDVTSGNLAQLLLGSVETTTLAVVLRDAQRLTGEIGDVIRTIPLLERLSEVSIRTKRALDTNEISSITKFYRAAERRGVRFFVDFWLDNQANAFAVLDRKATSLSPILEASQALRVQGIDVRWMVPMTRPLVHRLEAIFSLAGEDRIDAVLVPSWKMQTARSDPERELDEDDTLFVRDFLAHRLLEQDLHCLCPKRKAFYQAMLATLDAPNSPPGTSHRVAVLRQSRTVSAQWALYYECRPRFADMDWGEAPPKKKSMPALAHAVDVGGVILEGSRAVLEWASTKICSGFEEKHATRKGNQLPAAMMIGAYGGDHIGDAAILGGVLLRFKARHGTRRAYLMSQRPDHTQHLVRMLDTPVEVIVEQYSQDNAARLLQHVDVIVFAGGPLMDLPKQLVKHLYIVSLARRFGKPFMIEGVGAGPFVRFPSTWTARRLVLMADNIVVRTLADQSAPIMRGLYTTALPDPAFDYLETRGKKLTRLHARDDAWIESLLENTEGRVRIGVNVRPIRHLYTTETSSRNRAGHTRFIEARFEERLAEAMRKFHKTLPSPPCFIFFPMNAVQFGLSDLRSAYRIKRLTGGEVDFRVWEDDASIDGVIALMRELDVAITMRFHAAIYALSQKLSVIGVDYRVGIKDKVAALLDDFGQSENCCRIDEMTTDWLFDRLRQLSARRLKA